MDNANFLSVEIYTPKLELPEILDSIHTLHLNKSRLSRLEFANNLNQLAPIHTSFLVDKGHYNGPEIHNISERAIIYIVNARTRMFITVLLARPNQIVRLYKECGLIAPPNIVSFAVEYQKNGYNNF